MRPVQFTTEDLCREPKLRIALVAETYPPEINGVAMTLRRMVDGLVARGHHIQLVRPRQAYEETAASESGFEELLARGCRIPRYEGLRFGLPARAALIRTWSRQRPDLVHVATEGPLGWTAVSAASRLGLPVTSDFHTNFDEYSRHYGVGWLRQPVAAYLKRFHNRTAATFVPTVELARVLSSQGYRHVEVVSRGVDAALFGPDRRSAALRRSWGVRDDGLAVAYVGRIAPEKNLELVVKSFAALRRLRPDARLVMVGDGPQRAELMRDHPDFVFAGMRTGEDLAAHYASADLFLFPSLSETFGNVTLEAMASGLPIVAFRSAAAAELVRHGENGFAVDAGDSEGFVACAMTLAGDEELRSRMGSEARRTAQDRDWSAVIDSFSASLFRVWRAVMVTRDQSSAGAICSCRD